MHEFYDQNIEDQVNQGYLGNSDLIELLFYEKTDRCQLHKDDLVYIAKTLGLHVYESSAKL